jgi:hypothetical protein
LAGLLAVLMALGVRVFEMKHGRLPLRWNADSGRIYSVGKNGVDDGGDFKARGREIENKDWGVVHPWRGGDEE